MDICSSDIEFEPLPPDPWRGAGKASIAAMMEHASEDRIVSKRMTKQLRMNRQNPNSEYTLALWWNRFMEFRKHTLMTNVDEAPTGEHIERFLTCIVDRINPRGSSVPTHNWVTQGIDSVIENCAFYHADFTLSVHERSRLSSHVLGLLKAGKVTHEPARERHWVGVVIVRQLSIALANNAHKLGTLSWDYTLARILLIVLMSALGTRAGDISKGQHDTHHLPYLAYKDVVIKMAKGGTTIEDLAAVVTIRNEKGNKNNPKKNRNVLLRIIKSPEDSLICPIKLLLTVALRLGNVEDVTIDDLILHTLQRRDRTVAWKFPERPILCAFTPGCALNTDVPASNSQLTRIISKVGAEAGIVERIRGHDLRRGAARDTAHLKSEAQGRALATAAAVIGHSQSARDLSLTAYYVGDLADDVYTRRVEENFVDPIYELDTVDEAYPLKFQRTSTYEITKLCQSEGLDTSKPSDRLKASVLLAKRRKEDSVYQAGRKRQALNHFDTSVVRSASPNKTTIPFTDPEEFTGDDSNIDPFLEQGSLCDIITGNYRSEGEKRGEALNDGVQAMIWDSLQFPENPENTLSMSDSMSFVRYYSSINISCNQGLSNARTRVAARQLIQGNSRDPVSLFMYACKNALFGCCVRKAVKYELVCHEQVCTRTSHEVSTDLAAKEAVKEAAKKAAEEKAEETAEDTAKVLDCPFDDCSKTYALKSKLNRHIKGSHTWTPSPCRKGCDPTTLYQTMSAEEGHFEKHHSAFSSSTCQFPGCVSTVVFTTGRQYRKHIRHSHSVLGKDIDKHMPYQKTEKFTPTKCRVSQCTSKATFSNAAKYKSHLRDKHSMDEDEIEQLVG